MRKEKKNFMPKTYQLSDITNDEMNLLKTASSLQDEYFMCFGSCAFKLRSLGLINEENKITVYGKKFLHYVYSLQ